MKCKIQWIDETGKPTPDCNEAIGMAVISFRTNGRQTDQTSHPICAHHLARMPKFSSCYTTSSGKQESHWTFHPFLKEH